MAKSKLSRVLAVFLAIVMCFTMTTAIGFANTDPDSAPTDTAEKAGE